MDKWDNVWPFCSLWYVYAAVSAWIGMDFFFIDTYCLGCCILVCQENRAIRKYRCTRQSAVQRCTWLRWLLLQCSCRRCCRRRRPGGRRNRCGAGTPRLALGALWQNREILLLPTHDMCTRLLYLQYWMNTRGVPSVEKIGQVSLNSRNPFTRYECTTANMNRSKLLRISWETNKKWREYWTV